jgi:hypothetical protein
MENTGRMCFAGVPGQSMVMMVMFGFIHPMFFLQIFTRQI